MPINMQLNHKGNKSRRPPAVGGHNGIKEDVMFEL